MSWMSRKESLESRRGAYAKIEQGDNVFRLFEFKHTVTPIDFELGRYLPDTVKVGTVQTEGMVVVRKHFKPQFTMCDKVRSMSTGELIGDCEYCDRANEILDDPDASEQDKKATKRWLGGDQYVFVVVNVNESPMSYKTLELSRPSGMALLEMQQFAEKKGRTLFGLAGKDICIRYDKNHKNPKERYKIFEVDTTECVTLKGSSIAGPIPDLFIDPSFVGPAWQTKFRAAIGSSSSSTATQEEVTTAETVKTKPTKAKTAKAKAPAVPWPPVIGQDVMVTMEEGGEKQKGTVTSDESTEGAGIWGVEIDGTSYQCLLEEMEKIG